MPAPTLLTPDVHLRPLSRGVASRLLVRALGTLLRTCAWCASVVLLVIVGVHLLMQALPTDAADVLAGPGADPAQVDLLRSDLGLHRPVSEQVLDAIRGVMNGDLGTSVATSEPVAGQVFGRLAASAWIVVPAWLIAVVLGGWLSMRSALSTRGLAEKLVAFISGLPDAVVAVAVVVCFGLWWQVLPAVSLLDPGESAGQHPEILVLPVAALAVPGTVWVVRALAPTCRDVAQRDYVRAALERGHSRTRVAWAHVLGAVSGVYAQTSMLLAGSLLGGSVVVERVVAYPGLGELLASAMTSRDLPMVMGASIVLAAIMAVLLSLADAWTRHLERALHD